MPFTLSHAAAALPFRKLKPIWPALVMGTFAPDLQYFILLSDQNRSGHRFPDVLLFTLPVALVTLGLFEWIVKRPFVELLPSGAQRRLQDKLEPVAFRGWKQFGSIVLWMVVGIATHIVWDEFTHAYSWLPSHWLWLRAPVSVPFLHPMPLTKILQHTSTIFGLAILCAWAMGWYHRTQPVRVPGRREFSPLVKVTIVLTLGVVAVVAGYPLAILKLAGHSLPISQLTVIAVFFVAITFAFGVALLLYGLIVTIAARSRRVLEPEFDQASR